MLSLSPVQIDLATKQAPFCVATNNAQEPKAANPATFCVAANNSHGPIVSKDQTDCSERISNVLKSALKSSGSGEKPPKNVRFHELANVQTFTHTNFPDSQLFKSLSTEAPSKSQTPTKTENSPPSFEADYRVCRHHLKNKRYDALADSFCTLLQNHFEKSHSSARRFFRVKKSGKLFFNNLPFYVQASTLFYYKKALFRDGILISVPSLNTPLDTDRILLENHILDERFLKAVKKAIKSPFIQILLTQARMERETKNSHALTVCLDLGKLLLSTSSDLEHQRNYIRRYAQKLFSKLPKSLRGEIYYQFWLERDLTYGDPAKDLNNWAEQIIQNRPHPTFLEAAMPILNSGVRANLKKYPTLCNKFYRISYLMGKSRLDTSKALYFYQLFKLEFVTTENLNPFKSLVIGLSSYLSTENYAEFTKQIWIENGSPENVPEFGAKFFEKDPLHPLVIKAAFHLSFSIRTRLSSS